MAREGSWKAELDGKYNKLMNSGSVELMNRANDIILKAIEELDSVDKYRQETILCAQHFHSLKR